MKQICSFCNKESNLIKFTDEEIKVFEHLTSHYYCGKEECRRMALSEAHKLWAEKVVNEIEQERKERKEEGYNYVYEVLIEEFEDSRSEIYIYTTKILNDIELGIELDNANNGIPIKKIIGQACKEL